MGILMAHANQPENKQTNVRTSKQGPSIQCRVRPVKSDRPPTKRYIYQQRQKQTLWCYMAHIFGPRDRKVREPQG